ncbi:type II toxin-antitoxin system VapC family toxin [Wenzhouxiangella sp. XN79A]|uniref:type II toxin-antitoxin system VapC family toxin n=1 Tax=Wenzhouxiangella sp. XN79A TaxID=2724193 RepID=UPI00144A8E6F|nr:type II toxin-antitoxin system VapC family toxin [Wenzhouxiangella sp. XN79A]NKI35167.1 type II toxin-antitoxin system VapC family toxin [Wenzhouxiangella sp. XN79A]
MPAEAPLVAEPAGRYARKPPVVVDCSVLAAVLFDEPKREGAALAMAGKELFAPDLLDHEIVSVALKKSAAGHPDIAEHALVDLDAIQLTRCRVEADAQFRLAERTGLTAYDAAYLQLALELRAPLVTFDRLLGRIARDILADVRQRP